MCVLLLVQMNNEDNNNDNIQVSISLVIYLAVFLTVAELGQTKSLFGKQGLNYCSLLPSSVKAKTKLILLSLALILNNPTTPQPLPPRESNI